MNIRKEIIRFSIAGTVVGAIHFGIYYLLICFLSFNLSAGISFICAGIVAYLFNKYWTFKYKHPSLAELVRYTLINFLALGINIFINQHILSLWPSAVFLALVIASMSSGLVTFIGYKWWVFRAQLKGQQIGEQ
ncbi:MAG: GtrA family protein [Candidatus Omnitrophica bacterium]|nr:GtrA family protein [Candidatus Omnitrophota bacterium]